MPRSLRRARVRPTFRTDGDVALHVPDLDRAMAFYGGVLGFPVIERTADLVVFETGSLRLFVKRDASGVRPFIPALEVPSCHRAKTFLKQAGCRIVHEWPGGKALYFEDPFGLVLDIIERNPAEGRPGRGALRGDESPDRRPPRGPRLRPKRGAGRRR